MRNLLSVLALAVAAPCVAAPIRVTNLGWQTAITVQGSHTSPADAFVADPVERNSAGYVASYSSPTVFGWGRNTTVTYQKEDDRSYALKVSHTSEAFASVSSEAPSTTRVDAFAEFSNYWLAFDVLEAIEYELVGNSHWVSGSSDTGTGFSSREARGLLDPGSYVLRADLDGGNILPGVVRPLPGQTQMARSEGFGSFNAVAVPEPAMIVLFGSGLVAVALRRRSDRDASCTKSA
jgi:hypothetical protein